MSDNKLIHQLEQQLTDLDSEPQANEHKKIDALNDLAWLLRDTDTKRSFSLCNAAYSLSNSSDDNGQFYQEGMAYSLRTQGFLNMRSADYSKGLTQLRKAQQIFESLHLNDGLSDVFYGIYCIYYYLGDYPQALEMAYKQMDAAQQIRDTHRIADANNNVAYIYFELGDWEQGMDLLQRNLTFAQEIKDERIECAIYIKLLYAYLRAGDYQLALENGLCGLHKSQELGNKLFELRTHRLLAEHYIQVNDKARTYAHLEEALNLSREQGTKAYETLILITMGQAYRAFHQFDRAKEVLNQAVKLGQSINLKLDLFQSHLLLSEVYEELGDSTQALQHYKQYHAVKELVFNDKADQRLKVLQVAHDTETAQKEAEIAHLKTVELRSEIHEHTRLALQLQQQVDYEHALARCSQTLVTVAETEDAQLQVLNQAIENLRMGAQASRAYIFRNIDDADLGACMTNIAEACAPGVKAHIGHPSNKKAAWTRFPAVIYDKLQAGRPFGGPIKTVFANLPHEVEMYLNQPEPLLSLLCFPIFTGGQWWGFIGFDDCLAEREWNDQDLTLLGTAADMIAGTLQRWQAETDLRTLNEQLELQVEKRTGELSHSVKLLQREINERKRAEAEIQRMVEMLEQRVADRSRELAALYDMTILFTDAKNLTDTLEPALHNICQNVWGSGISVHILSADKSHLQLTAHFDLFEWEQMQQIALTSDFANWLNQAVTPLMVTDNKNTHSFLPRKLLLPTYRTYISIPLQVRNEVIGLLGVYRKERQPFDLQKVSLLITMAEQLGIIIQNQRLQGQSRQVARTIERQRIARELHDSVAQRLYSLQLFARAGREALLDDDQDETLLRLQQVEENTFSALREMRLLLYQLRPLSLDTNSLPAVFEKRFDLVERRLGIAATIEICNTPELAEYITEELYYIITEALNNALKHAEATEIKLLFSLVDDQTLILIQDNGHGFDLAQISSGFGLENMCQRAEKINGLVTMESTIGQGTTVRLTV